MRRVAHYNRSAYGYAAKSGPFDKIYKLSMHPVVVETVVIAGTSRICSAKHGTAPGSRGNRVCIDTNIRAVSIERGRLGAPRLSAFDVQFDLNSGNVTFHAAAHTMPPK